MFKKIKDILSAAFYVAKITQLKNKKLRIIGSIVLSNIAVFLDLIIIVTIGYQLTKSVNYDSAFVIRVVDIVLSNGSYLVLIVFLRFLFVFAEGFNLDLLVVQVKENLKAYLFEKMFKSGNYSTADIFFYVNNVTQHVSTFFRTVAKVLNSLTQSLTLFIYLVVTSPEALSAFFLGAIVLAYPSYKLLALGKKYAHFFYENSQNLNRRVQKIVENMFLIKILKTVDYEFNNFKIALKELKEVQVKNYIYGSINSTIPSFLVLFVLSVVISFTRFVSYLTIDFVGVVLKLFTTLSSFNNMLALTFNSYVHVEKLYTLDKNLKIDYSNNVVQSDDKKLIVKFENADFKYFNSKDLIFENLNLKIEKNSHTVITGPNGSGKSTLLGLIAGLFYPTSGKVIKYFDKVGYVGVNPLILPDTLKANLMYGCNDEIENDSLLAFLEELKIFDKIDESTLDLKVDNKSLSSGQIQKISFIRALINNPELLILDESTSNLDVETKIIIPKILKKKNLTIVNSTHNKELFTFDNELEIVIEEKSRKVISV